MKCRLAPVIVTSCLLVPGLTRADIPPPPPPPPPPSTVPIINVPMPETWQVVGSGAALSLAMASLGLWVARRRLARAPGPRGLPLAAEDGPAR